MQIEDRVVSTRRRVEPDLASRFLARLLRIVRDGGDHVAGQIERIAIALPGVQTFFDSGTDGFRKVASRVERVPHQAVGHLPCRAEHVAVHASQVDGDVRADKARPEVEVDRDVEEAPFVLEGTSLRRRPEGTQDLDNLDRFGCGALELEAVPGLLHTLRAGSKPENRASVGDLIDVRYRRRRVHGRAPECVGDAAADTDALGGLSGRRHTNERASIMEVRQPNRVEAGLFGLPGVFDKVLNRIQDKDQRLSHER